MRIKNGETIAGRIEITLSVEEFSELVKLQDSDARYELWDTGISSPFAVSQAEKFFLIWIQF